MRKLILITMLGLVSLVSQASVVVTDTIYSPTLDDDIPYCVYLPDGYDDEENATTFYPVVYLMHGLGQSVTDWRDKGHMQQVADEVIANGSSVPLIIITPKGGAPDTQNVWNGWFDMPGWPIETAFFRDFLPGVEERYRITPDKGHRSVMGLSMGGGGCVVYAQRHSDMFSSCYTMSAWLHSLGGKGTVKTKNWYLRESVKARSARRYVELADEQQKRQLRSIAWFVDCGDDDPLLDDCTTFHLLMRKAKIPCQLRVRDGAHTWDYWTEALRIALPFASQNFK